MGGDPHIQRRSKAVTEEEFRTGSMPQKYAEVVFGSLSNGASQVFPEVPRRPLLSTLRRIDYLASLGFAAPVGMEDALRRFRARPRIRIRQDGFIIHDGGECPVPPWTRVEVEVIGVNIGRDNPYHSTGKAGHYDYHMVSSWWEGKRHVRIVAYRIVR
jgi:hypothetical protein